MEEVNSEDQSVLIAEEVAVIEDLEEKSILNRAEKVVSSISQN
jgi:hypothetical protein